MALGVDPLDLGFKLREPRIHLGRKVNIDVLPFRRQALKRILRKRELRAADIDHFLPHYSSEFFRERLAEGLAEADLPIPQERWFTNLTSKGNTGAASIFIILEELFNGGRLRRGERLLCYVPESGRFSSAFMHLTVVGNEA